MNILFLDIDGVLVTHRSHLGLGFYGGHMTEFDPIGVGLLKQVCDKYDVKIVISSIWRYDEPVLLGEQLNKHDLMKYMHDNWRTILIPKSRNRGKEIQAWLDINEPCTYAILDDGKDMLEHQMKYLVKTNTFEGISWENFLELRNIYKHEKTKSNWEMIKYHLKQIYYEWK
jgi:hypothetical protein